MNRKALQVFYECLFGISCHVLYSEQENQANQQEEEQGRGRTKDQKKEDRASK